MTWSLGETELLLVSGGVCEGVSWRNRVWSPLERSLLQTCTPGFGNGGEGVRDPVIAVIVPGERESREFAVWGLGDLMAGLSGS